MQRGRATCMANADGCAASRPPSRQQPSAKNRALGCTHTLLLHRAPCNAQCWLLIPMRSAACFLAFGKQVEVDYEGRKEKWMSGVTIKKCRYLESSGCVGMCTNM